MSERAFVYVPRAANLLRQREQHIALLQQELQQTKSWLIESRGERDRLLEMFRKQQTELEEHNAWAQRLSAELSASSARVLELQNEMELQHQKAQAVVAGYEAHVQELDKTLAQTVAWGRTIESQAEAAQAQLSAALDERTRDLTECIAHLDRAETTVIERTTWAQRLEIERNELTAELNKVRASRWLKLGRKIGMGPAVKA